MNKIISSGAEDVREKVEVAEGFLGISGTRNTIKLRLRDARDFLPGALIELGIITLIIAAVCVGIMVLRFKVFGSF